MHISNPSSYSNAELLRFLDGHADPIIKELCSRLSGKGSDDTIEIDYLESNLSEAESNLERTEKELEDAELRIGVLEELLTKNKIEFPV